MVNDVASAAIDKLRGSGHEDQPWASEVRHDPGLIRELLRLLVRCRHEARAHEPGQIDGCLAQVGDHGGIRRWVGILLARQSGLVDSHRR